MGYTETMLQAAKDTPKGKPATLPQYACSYCFMPSHGTKVHLACEKPVTPRQRVALYGVLNDIGQAVLDNPVPWAQALRIAHGLPALEAAASRLRRLAEAERSDEAWHVLTLANRDGLDAVVRFLKGGDNT